MSSKKQRKAAIAAKAREAARVEATRAKQEAEAKIRRQRTIVLGAILGAIVVTAALVVIVVKVFSGASSPTNVEAKPSGATDNGGILVGQAGKAGGEAPEGDDVVTVEIYSDYMCPYCGALEKAIAGKLDELVKAGDVRLVLHPLAFLDRFSNDTEYSSRSANAAATVAAQDPDHFLAFHQALFDQQPEENSDGLTDDQIALAATGVGVPQEVADTFIEALYADWVAASTAQAVNDGVPATPKVFMALGGGERETWANWMSGAIVQAVDAVKEGKKPDEGTPQ